ncbi:hypothetical protein LEP1GSC170_0237 [Leptospira interrogans serovar Bataviae str. HAI135]|nr:hypothetical protein LEP1GSC170_0237 [Leptospira interrogans serovar Bataviae str. HAI135]
MKLNTNSIDSKLIIELRKIYFLGFIKTKENYRFELIKTHIEFG